MNTFLHSRMAVGIALAGLVYLGDLAAMAQNDLQRHIKYRIIEIEVDVLMEKFSELTKRYHKADLELLELRSEREFFGDEEDGAQMERRRAIAQGLHSLEVLMEMAQEKRDGVRKQLHHLAGGLWRQLKQVE